jgi:hypothetical protein
VTEQRSVCDMRAPAGGVPVSGPLAAHPSLREPTPYSNLRMRMGSLEQSERGPSHSSDDTTSGIAITASVRTGGPLG